MTLQTQYKIFLEENPDSNYTYEQWMEYKFPKLPVNFEPEVSDNFQIGPDGAFEYDEDDLKDWDNTLLDGLEEDDLYFQSDILGKIKSAKTDLWKVNSELESELKKLVNKIVAEPYREEALNILIKSDGNTIKDFLFFAISDNGNLACMAIDSAKDKSGNKLGGKFFGNQNWE